MRLRTSISASLNAGADDPFVKNMKEFEELALDAFIIGFDWNSCTGDVGFCICSGIRRGGGGSASLARMAPSEISPRTKGQACYSCTMLRLTSITLYWIGYESIRVADR